MKSNLTNRTGRAAPDRTPKPGALRLAAIAGAAVCLAAGSAAGDGYICSWTAGTGAWSVPGNWTNRKPIVGDFAVIDNGGTANLTTTEACDWLLLGYQTSPLTGTVNMTSGSLAINLLNVAYAANSTGTFHLSGGTLNTAGTVSISDSDGANGQFELSNTGDLNTGYIHVGIKGTGTFTQYGGSAATTNAFDHWLCVGGRPHSSWPAASGTGTYNLSAGDLYSWNAIIGGGGTGTFNHTGGWFYVEDTMSIGKLAGAVGTYTLDGVSADLDVGGASGGSLTLGVLGTGTFNWKQGSLDAVAINIYSGGTMNVGMDWQSHRYFNVNGGDLNVQSFDSVPIPKDLILDETASYQCRGRVTAGTLDARSLIVGDTLSRQAQFTQDGGTVTTSGTTGSSLTIGREAAGNGRYDLNGSGSTLNVKLLEHIGSYGTGVFKQTDGTHTVTGPLSTLVLGRYADSNGTYTMTGGNLAAVKKIIGWAGTGTFNHQGGTNDPVLYVGYESGSLGTYNLSGTGVLYGDEEYIGFEGEGHFVHTGGSNEVGGPLFIGHGVGGVGSYEISGGQLSTGALQVGVDGHGALTIGDPSAEVFVSQSLRFGPDSELVAVPGAEIRMTGASFENASVDPLALAGLESLRLIFEEGSESIAPVEVGGRDYGPSEEGLVGNFALEALIIGAGAPGMVELVDTFDNQPAWVGSEALYVRDLEIGPGSYLDLNGLNLYYVEGLIDETATIVLDGGVLAPIPFAWVERFDSYETSTPLPDQSAWEPWDGNPSAAQFYASTAQARSEPNSVAIDDIDDAVHQYAGYTSGVWEYTAWVYVPAGMDDRQVFVLLNTYPASAYSHWSLEIEFDGAAGTVDDLDGTDSLPMIRGSWAEIRVVIDLDTDVQSAYYDGDLLVTKGWTDGVEPGGALNIAAVDLWGASSASEVYYDDMSLTAYDGEPCPADLDGSGAVDFGDILAILSTWDDTGSPNDLDGSGTVDFGDLIVVLSSWGPCD